MTELHSTGCERAFLSIRRTRERLRAVAACCQAYTPSPGTGGSRLAAAEMGKPLLPAPQRIANIALNPLGQGARFALELACDRVLSLNFEKAAFELVPERPRAPALDVPFVLLPLQIRLAKPEAISKISFLVLGVALVLVLLVLVANGRFRQTDAVIVGFIRERSDPIRYRSAISPAEKLIRQIRPK